MRTDRDILHLLSRVVLVGVLAIAPLGCASRASAPDRLLVPAARGLDANAPLGGASLAQRRSDLVRAERDLVGMRATVLTLRQRRDRSGLVMFKTFLEDYVTTKLEPVLAAEWQSDHPELLGLDASIRLVQAELFMSLGDRRRMERIVQNIERRFAGREEMLVDYPVGKQTTLREALELLTHQKWWG